MPTVGAPTVEWPMKIAPPSIAREGGLDVAYEFRGAFQFHAVRNRYIADDLAVDDDGLGVDFRADDGILAYGEHPFGRNVAFNGAVNQQVVGKTQGADNLHVGVQHVAGQLLDARSGGVGSGGGYGFRNRFGVSWLLATSIQLGVDSGFLLPLGAGTVVNDPNMALKRGRGER